MYLFSHIYTYIYIYLCIYLHILNCFSVIIIVRNTSGYD